MGRGGGKKDTIAPSFNEVRKKGRVPQGAGGRQKKGGEKRERVAGVTILFMIVSEWSEGSEKKKRDLAWNNTTHVLAKGRSKYSAWCEGKERRRKENRRSSLHHCPAE